MWINSGLQTILDIEAVSFESTNYVLYFFFSNRIFRIFNADESIWKRLKTEIDVPSCERIDHIVNQLVSKNTGIRICIKFVWIVNH